MTVLEVIQRSTAFLTRKGVESPRLQVELLLSHALGLPRLRLYLEFERVVPETVLDRVRELVRRRGEREPLQHLVGSVSFCGLELEVNPAVLIPRPETELLAERAWRHLQGLNATVPRALDFGTGSGCLAIAVAVHCPAAHVLALDVSPAALEVARRNAARHAVADRIRFVRADGLRAVQAVGEFSLLMSNPPYIPSAEIATLAPEVRDHDPRVALDGGGDGLAFFRRLARDGGRLLASGGTLLAEFGDGQEAHLPALFAAEGWRVEGVEADDTGRPRILIARRWGS